MPLIFVIAAGAGDVEQDAAETGSSEIDLHIGLRSSRGRGVGRSLYPALRDQRRSKSKRHGANQSSLTKFEFCVHNFVFCRVACSFSRVSSFVHPETGRDLAGEAANYFEENAKEAVNAKAPVLRGSTRLT